MANDNIRNFKIEETFTEVIKPIEVFSEILTDLAFSSYIRTLRALRRAFYRRSIAYICQIMLTN